MQVECIQIEFCNFPTNNFPTLFCRCGECSESWLRLGYERLRSLRTQRIPPCKVSDQLKMPRMINLQITKYQYCSMPHYWLTGMVSQFTPLGKGHACSHGFQSWLLTEFSSGYCKRIAFFLAPLEVESLCQIKYTAKCTFIKV